MPTNLTNRTEGTKIIEHDWDRIKLPTDKYGVSKMRIKIFRYKIIGGNTYVR